MKTLIIVESPAKAKTINKILGKGFAVRASIGHVRDLPEKELGVDIDNNFKPKYIVIPGKEKIIKELKEAATKADVIYLAPDPDREGEAIAWHISELLKNGKKASVSGDRIFRITFNEITERAVKEAIKRPGKIDMNKVDAQQARRILDRLVGYKLSPLLWKKIKKGLSAGRVQSVAVRLVVEREREIEAFVPKEYWSITGVFEGSNPPSFKARLFKYKGKYVINREKEEFLIQNEAEAEKLIKELEGYRYILSKVDKKLRKRNPPQPFITSTLQQEASKTLRFSPKKTMMIAQQLYEGVEIGEEGSIGLITYMRTDSTRVAEEAQEAARELIKNLYGEKYVPKDAVRKTKKATKAKVQDAHEAIRPTYLTRPPESVKKFLSRDQYLLYRLIWMRFLASQMAPAEIEQTTFVISDTDSRVEFRVTGDILKFDGFLKLYSYSEEGDRETQEEGQLPPLKEGELLKLSELIPKQHFTQPPPRYTEATLIKALEEKGVGRPSTYATILSTIQERRYVKKREGRLVPTELGRLVNDYLVERFPELIDVGFTAKMEDELDKVEEGNLNWLKVVKSFYRPFSKDLQKAFETSDKAIEDQPTELTCELCGRQMVKRWGRHGWFYACTGFPECKNTKPINNTEDKEPEEVADQRCPECGSEMIIKQSRFGRFIACSRYPECRTTLPLSTGVKCPLDGGDIIERRSKKGKLFWSCSNWPKCKFTLWSRPINEACPKCGSPYLLEKTQNSKRQIVCPEKGCDYKRIEREEKAEEAVVSKE